MPYNFENILTIRHLVLILDVLSVYLCSKIHKRKSAVHITYTNINSTGKLEFTIVYNATLNVVVDVKFNIIVFKCF